MKGNYYLAKNQLIDAIKDDSLILFVGSGISKNSGLPTWGELIDIFSAELNISEESPDLSDYLRIAQYYYDTFGKNQYMKRIEEVFSSKGATVPNRLHELIEILSPKHIITTNYDTLLEQQFENGMLRYNVVASDKDIPYVKSEKYLIKMHGDFRKKNIVLKEDDYLDYHLNFPMISTLIQSLIMNHTILFVGYSLSDSTFNSIFRLIQNNFELDAKVAYFYTPDGLSTIVRDYYKKKGIFIISNDFKESCISDNSSSKGNRDYELFERTKNFLEDITNSKRKKIRNADDLWNQISFLDKLYFIDFRDFLKYSNLKGSVYIDSGGYFWSTREGVGFEIDNHGKIKDLIEKKSILNNFFDLDLNESRNLTANKYMAEVFVLYQEKKYSLAKAKFRELANASYRRKDYFTFLLCEFNFKHIHTFWRDEEDYQEPIFLEELSELTQQIIDSTSGNDKKILEYFRDTILNTSFLDRKLECINDLFDKIREEHNLYKRGGSSYNNNLWNAEYEIQNLQDFIELNCICVEQYRPYKAIINRYFEILLLSYDNSNLKKSNSSDVFYNVSSVIKELELNDAKIILPRLNLKLLRMYLRNYSFSKIKISNETRRFLFDKIEELQQIDRLDNLEIYQECKRLLSFLSFIEYKDDNISQLITILDRQILYFDLSDEIKGILKTIILNIECISSDLEKKQLITIIERHINDIINDNLEIHYNNFELYAELLHLCKLEGTNATISVEKLRVDILKLKYEDIDIRGIFKYTKFFVNFFEFLSVETQGDIFEFFAKYEEEDSIEIRYHEIIELMLSEIFDFSKIQKDVYTYLMGRINAEESATKSYPDPLKTSLSDLFNLKNKGYFAEISITDMIQDIKKDIKGIFPEVDWKWFNDRSDRVMKRLLEHRTPSDIKKYYATTEEDKERLNSLIVRLLDERKIEFNNR